MKNLSQIKMLSKALESQKSKMLTDLSNLNSYIEKKLANIKKFLLFQKEYADENNLKLTKSVPMLSKNLESFGNKLKDIIYSEEKEVINLNKSKQIMVSKLEMLNQKIKAIGKFEKIAYDEIRLKNDKIEQASIDDLSSIKQSRGEHE